MEIKTNDFYDDIKNSLIDKFDTSDYSEKNVYNMPLENKKVLGKFKAELSGQIMEDFIGLRSKLYAYKLFENGKEAKKAKAIKRNVVQKEISFVDFRNCFLTKNPIYKKQNVFKTDKHDIYTVELNKKALSAYDDKRFILGNGINTLAWGHFKINIEKGKFPNHLKELQTHEL